MKKIRALFFILVVAAMLLLPVPAMADDPTSLNIPESYVHVFRNLAETGDMLVVFEYNIAFASDNYSLAPAPASESFVFRLYNTDGTTLLATSTPYVYPFFENNGYGTGISSFYFSATDTKPAWGSACVIQLYGWPMSWTNPQLFNRTLTSSRYTSSTTPEANQSELYNYVLLMADKLASDYADTGVILKATSDSGIILSSYGELYFRGAISGLQSLCPSLFYIQVYIPSPSATSYNMSLQTTYTSRLATDDVGRGLTRLGSSVGVSAGFLGAALVFAAGIFLMIFTIKKGWGIEPGAFVAALLGTMAAILLGSFTFTILIILALLAGMGIVWLLLLRRTG